MRPITARTVGATNASTAAYVASDQVPPGEIWVLDFASLYNQSGESVTLQWCILAGATAIVISADSTVADGKAVDTIELPALREGENFAARVTGAANKGPVILVFSARRVSLSTLSEATP